MPVINLIPQLRWKHIPGLLSNWSYRDQLAITPHLCLKLAINALSV